MSLSQIYMLCGGFGILWVVGTAVFGFVDSGDAADAGGDLGSADAGGDPGPADAGGDPGSADAGGDLGSADAGGDLGNLELKPVNSFRAGMVMRKRRLSPVLLILKLLSPSTITAFLFFFGLIGYLILSYLPALGSWSIAPAIAAGIIGYNCWSAMTSAIIKRMHVSNSYSHEDMIGRRAEVTVTINGSTMGEVTYSAKGVRETAPAKALDGSTLFKRGVPVMLADLRDGVYYVEPWEHDLEGQIVQFPDKVNKA